MPIRVYDISKKLGLENKEVLNKAKQLGIAAARVASSSLDAITASYLEQQLISDHPEGTSPAPPFPPPVPCKWPIVVAPDLSNRPAPLSSAGGVPTPPKGLAETINSPRLATKLEKLKQSADAGSDVILIIAGGGEIRGRIVRFEESLIVINQDGHERMIFEDSINGFGIIPARGAKASDDPATPSCASPDPGATRSEPRPQEGGRAPDPQPPAQAHPEEAVEAALSTHAISQAHQTVDQPILTGMSALEYLDSVRKALRSSPTSIDTARQAAEALAANYKNAPLALQRDSNIRYALISVFKALEYERKLRLAQDASSLDALELGNTLLAINSALRAPAGIRDEDRFADHYHFLVAIRPHGQHFQSEPVVWNALGVSMREAYRLGTLIMNDPANVARWDREPHRRQTHLYRLSELCRHLVLFGFAGPEESGKFQEQAEGFAVMAGRQPVTQPPTEIAMGRIVSFGTQRFGFIQTRDARTLFFHLDDVMVPTLSDALEGTVFDASGVLEIEVDFDEAVRPGHKYDAATHIRPVGQVYGTIQTVMADRNFGYIDLPDGRALHFRLSNVTTAGGPLAPGTPVVCRPVQEQRGWAAREVSVIQAPPPPVPVSGDAQRILGAAQIARERGDISEATALYEQGLRECPVPQMFLSYASMTKESDAHRAMEIYGRGIDQFPDKYKIYEDAGVHAAGQQLHDFPRAVELLERALECSRRDPAHAGEKGVLLALARIHYHIGTEDSLRRASKLYEEVSKLFGGSDAFRARLPRAIIDQADAIQATLARLRSANERTNRAFGFLENVGFKVFDARYSESQNHADLVCDISDPDLIKDFRLGQRVLIRCMVSEQAPTGDFRPLEEQVAKAAARDNCDPSVALLVTPSVTRGLENSLWERLEPRPQSKNKPLVIIPLPQRDLEKSLEPMQTLRQALSTWLYRRDLFPVSGSVTGADFFGRKNVLAEIHDALLIGQPLGIFGLRKTGKTSVLLSVLARQRKENNIVLHVDLLKEKGKRLIFPSVFCGLAEDLQTQAKVHLPPTFSWDLAGKFDSVLRIGDFPIFDAFSSDLTRVLRALQAQPAETRPRIIVMLDEIEELQHASLSHTLDFLGALRGIHQSFRDGFNLVVTAANPSVSEITQFEGRDNPVFNFLREIYLPLLDTSECTEMITELGRGMGLRFTDGACRRVFEATGGHPFVTRQLCSFASKQHKQRPVELQETDIRAAEGAYLSEHGDRDMQEIIDRLVRDYPRENDLLRQLANRRGQQDVGIAAKEFKHLRDYQLVEQGPQGITHRLALMESWLRGDHPGRAIPAPLEPRTPDPRRPDRRPFRPYGPQKWRHP